jgi:DNA repair protein SbcD/Mre11
MRILHTADWHLNDRLGRIDRTTDLRASVEQVGRYCAEHHVDVLIVAGDLFSELARAEALRESLNHWQEVFADFLLRGGTILTTTGNHDNENFCQTLRSAMHLAAPAVDRVGELVPTGRLYLASDPTFLRLNVKGQEAQFTLMPYPTAAHYLIGVEASNYSNPDEKQRLLNHAFDQKLLEFQAHERYRPDTTNVLIAHANVFGAVVGESLFRISPQEDVVLNGMTFAEKYHYVALGHIHKEQFLGHEHIRYSGSVQKLDLGEQHDLKSVTLFDLDSTGAVQNLTLLPMSSVPVYELTMHDPDTDLPQWKIDYADATDDLVKLNIHYTAGQHNLEELLRECGKLLPRWYARSWKESRAPGLTLVPGEADRSRSFGDTVRGYLGTELTNYDDAERGELLKIVEELMAE